MSRITRRLFLWTAISIGTCVCFANSGIAQTPEMLPAINEDKAKEIYEDTIRAAYEIFEADMKDAEKTSEKIKKQEIDSGWESFKIRQLKAIVRIIDC